MADENSMILVPREPTPEMCAAGGHVNSEWLNDNAPIGESRYVQPMAGAWAAMIAASPQTQPRAAADAPAAPSGWQPIETAPVEQVILVWDERFGAMLGEQDDYGWNTVPNDGHGFATRFTHWMPLPAAPA